jgi:hypothetical protein
MLALYAAHHLHASARSLGALVLGAAASSVVGLLVETPLKSVENFTGIINVVLFPMLFLNLSVMGRHTRMRPSRAHAGSQKRSPE